MKKNYRILLVFLLVLLPLNVWASSIKGSLIIENRTIKKSEYVEVTLKLEEVSKKEMTSFQTVISFDENIFEGIEEKSIKTFNGWDDVVYNKVTHSLILTNKYGTTLNEKIASFKIKAKDTVYPTKTKIELKHTIVANAQEEIEVGDISSQLNVSVAKNEMTSNSKKVFTGKALLVQSAKDYTFMIIIILELIIATILVLIYNTSKKTIKTDKQRRALFMVLCTVEIFAISAIFVYDVKRGDLNGDGKIDSKDVEILSKSLVNTSSLGKFNLAKADMNKDGLLTLQDLAILTQKSTTKAKYEALLTDAVTESIGYEKGSEVDFRFYAEVTNDETIKYIMIDGKKYKAEKLEENKNEYRVKIEASNVSKNHKYNVSEVIFENGQSAKVNYEKKVIVLKDKPEIESYASTVNQEASSASVALTIDDKDDSITSATYELVKSSGQVVDSGKLNKGKNTFTFRLENAVSYKFKIKIEYDRGDKAEENKGLIEDSYDLKVVADYRFKIDTLELTQNNQVVSILQKGIAAKLLFNSTNISGYNPKKVVINGKQYNVSKNGINKYAVAIPNDTIISNNKLTISKVILSNGKVILTNEVLPYALQKKEPSYKGISINENLVTSKIDVDLDIKDEDSALSKLIVRLFDEFGVVDEKIITDKNYVLSLNSSRLASKYKIQVLASYSLVSGNGAYDVFDKVLYETSFDAKLKVYLNKYETDSSYPEKNSTIKLIYNVSSNHNKNILKAVINNVIYEVKKTDIDTYEVEYDVPENPGKLYFNTSALIFEDETEYILDETLSVDVLKQKPVIDNFEIVENKKESNISVAFDLYDKDDAFKRGKVRLVEKESRKVKDEKDVLIGKNTVTFNLENAIKYDVEIVADAVLDSEENEEESLNKLENFVLKSSEYRIITDYKFDLTSIETANNGTVTDKFTTGVDIDLALASTNITEFVPIKVRINGTDYECHTENGISKFTIGGFDTVGEKILRFEKVTLSNHVELEINGTKTIEIIKSVPRLESIELEPTDMSIKVDVSIDDKDHSITSLKALVLDGETEILNQVITEDTFTFNKTSSSTYTIKILADYKLDDKNPSVEEHLGVELYSKEIDFSQSPLNKQDIKDFTLKKSEDNGDITEITLESLKDVELYRITLVFKDDSEKIYEIDKIRILEETVFLSLKTDKWVSSENGKWIRQLEIEYGKVVDGKIIKESTVKAPETNEDDNNTDTNTKEEI